jgi:histone acetyltransferase 1
MIMLHRLNKYDAQSYAQYRLWVKQRLYKQNKDALMEVEFGDRIAKLQHTFDNVEQDYRAILKSIST